MALTNYPPVAERIALKLALLRKWVVEGVPPGATFPTSLAKARVWDDPEIGAFYVGSKREWSSKTSPYRSSIVAIDVLVKAISKGACRATKLKRRSSSVRIDELENLLEAVELAREEATGQWQATSQKLRTTEIELAAAVAEKEYAKSQLERARLEILDLKKRLFDIRAL